MFDATISLGSILTIASFLIGGVAFAFSIKSDTKVLDTKFTMIDAQIEDFKVELRKINEVLVGLAVQSGRIDRVEDRQLSEGKRLDAFEVRFNKYVNGTHERD